MSRHLPGLHQEIGDRDLPVEGAFLVRVLSAEYRWQSQKPFLDLTFVVRQPDNFANAHISGRVYCTPRAFWKLNWFLRDFGYDGDLLGRDQIDEKAVVGLTGVVRTAKRVFANRRYLNLESFAPESQWNSSGQCSVPNGAKVGGRHYDL